MDPHCYGSIQICALRAARLAPSGVPLTGADNMYVSDATIDLSVAMQVQEGEEKTQRNGCAAVCQTLTEPDRITRIDLGLTLCQLDYELIELLTGSTLIVEDGSGATLGVEFPGPTDDISADGVYIEAWSKAWDGDAQAGNDDLGDPLYHHFVFPRVRWVPGNFTLNAEFLSFPVSGKASTNPNGGNGPNNDLPHTFTKLGGIYLDPTLPVAACGYLPVPAQS